MEYSPFSGECRDSGIIYPEITCFQVCFPSDCMIRGLKLIKSLLYLCENAALDQLCIMLCKFGRTVAKHFCDHFQPDTLVQASGRISVPGDVRV